MLKRKPDVPSCLKILGFTQMPKNKNQIKARYRQLVNKLPYAFKYSNWIDFKFS